MDEKEQKFTTGQVVQVSDVKGEWENGTRRFIAMLNGWFMCEASHDPEKPLPWKYARAVKPQYRDPVMPEDYGKECEFSDDGIQWAGSVLCGCRGGSQYPWLSSSFTWKLARIKIDS